jgi:type I restriction enzyme M protein
MTRRLWFLREIRRLEREANIIADLPRQYGKPEEYRFYKGDPNNDIQPVSKESLIGAIKKCHQTLWAGGKLSPLAAL